MHCILDSEIRRAHPRLMGSLYVIMWGFMIMMIGVQEKQHKPFSVINALWPWPLDPQINRTHPRPLGVFVWSFMMIAVKGKRLMQQTPFSVINALRPWPLDPKINRAHPWLMGNLCMNIHDDRCKGKAIMRHKPFSVVNALWPWPLTLKSIWHILRSWGVFVWSFMIKCKQLCARILLPNLTFFGYQCIVTFTFEPKNH